MFGNDWDNILKEEIDKEYFKNIIKFIDREYKNKIIYPDRENLFRCFKLTSFENIKVVILGQDPYHEYGEANGLCFSVNPGIKIPPSLRNIFKELKTDTGIIRTNTDLSDWAMNGVLLLNSILTVEDGKAESHKDIGWTIFTDNVIKKIDESKRNIVFILWGNYAKSKISLIKNNYVISSPHPSPLSASRGFFGSRPFSKTNEYLKEHNIEEIEW